MSAGSVKASRTSNDPRESINGLPVAAQRPADGSEIDQAVRELRASAHRTHGLDIEERIRLAEACVERVAQASGDWVDLACRAKWNAIDNRGWRAEEIAAGPLATVRYLRSLIRSLITVGMDGRPHLPRSVWTEADGRVRVPIFPAEGFYDTLMLLGFKGHVVLEPGMTRAHFEREHGCCIRESEHAATTTSLVLAAGNVSSISVTDTLQKTLVEGKRVLLKTSPVNAYLGPIFEWALSPLVDAGYLRIVSGGADVGAAAIRHPGVNEVHITGATETHDAIVWGPPGPERDRRRRAKEPLLTKPITSELGNVTPWIFVPGPYTPRQLAFQAENLAASFTCNASFNCVAPRVVITWKRWPDRDRFLDLFQAQLDAIPPRPAYYPGALERCRNVLGVAPESNVPGALYWTFLRNVDQAESRFFEHDCFAPICVEVALDAESEADFLERAVDFANERLWGNLAASLTVHPRFRRQAGNEALFQRCLSRLKYSSVGVNCWPGLMYSLMNFPWGGAPGNTLENPQSGIGFVHNTYLLEHISKSILESPVTMFPKPFWFPTHSDPERIALGLLEIYHHPSAWKLPSFFSHALAE